jgi:starch-binding outer membrane protein, SusD/RagB family
MKLKIAAFSILLTVGLASCKKEYLTLDPIDRYVYYNFLENENQVEQAVVACYRKAFAVTNGYLWFWGDYLSDNTSFRYNPSDRGGIMGEQIDEFVATADNTNFNGMYQESFEGVGRANYVLQGIAAVKFTSDSVKTIREGEALFFRAWNYFNLVRLYGDCPILKKVLVDPSESKTLVRQPVADVYSQIIIPDAQAAAAKLPTTVPANQKGRITKGAALMLLAEALMTQKKFSEALPHLQAITTHGYALNARYVDNFDPTKKNGIESIFEIQADPALGYNFTVNGSWTPWGTGTSIWPGGTNSRGGLNQPTDDLDKAYEAADTIRKNVTVGRFVSGTNPEILYMKKWLYWEPTNRTSNANFVLYRYADALLMLAECQNETTPLSTEAFKNLNLVRKRAGLADKTTANTTSQAAFRLAIEKERQVELAGEAHRWFDLVRTGRAEVVMKEHGTREKLLKNTVDRNAYNTIKLLLAIPFREIQQFGFPQNVGW